MVVETFKKEVINIKGKPGKVK
jgi:hypothetical protein